MWFKTSLVALVVTSILLLASVVVVERAVMQARDAGANVNLARSVGLKTAAGALAERALNLALVRDGLYTIAGSLALITLTTGLWSVRGYLRQRKSPFEVIVLVAFYIACIVGLTMGVRDSIYWTPSAGGSVAASGTNSFLGIPLPWGRAVATPTPQPVQNPYDNYFYKPYPTYTPR